MEVCVVLTDTRAGHDWLSADCRFFSFALPRSFAPLLPASIRCNSGVIQLLKVTHVQYFAKGKMRLIVSILRCAIKWNLRNILLEGLFIPQLMLRFPSILSGKHNWMRGFHRPSKMRFLRLRFGLVLVQFRLYGLAV